MSAEIKIINTLKCFHCGLECDDSIIIDDKAFCCTGCKTVYEILNNNGLNRYYSLQDSPGIKQAPAYAKFDYLDSPDIFNRLIDFSDDKIAVITFHIPQMHCSSCIWLLENLYKLSPLINESKVNFLKKTVVVKFYHKGISLKELVILLTSLGYEPLISLDKIETDNRNKNKKSNKEIHYRVGVAAFCFGNIMLLSFPEYLSINPEGNLYRSFFIYLNFLLSLPVFFYSASGYFTSAWKGLKRNIINIDFPLSLGILVLFLRSVYELFILGEAGYFDSLAGLVFFLLLGKLFQSKTYEALNFERDYKAYFPLAVIKKAGETEKSVPVSELITGDRIILRNNEIIPADGLLIKGEGYIDYSFVTGESIPVLKKEEELLYAGGKQTGAAIEVEVSKEVSRSYLTGLWNNSTFNKPGESNFTVFSNTISKYFTYAILSIAFISSSIHLLNGVNDAFNVFTAVLIVACPCALAMSVPFTFGNSMRILGRNKFYLKNIRTVEDIAKIDTIVFDKTGTLTRSGDAEIHADIELNDFQAGMVKSLVRNSTHPFSRKIYDFFSDAPVYDITSYKEEANKGIEGFVLATKIMLGSKQFITGSDDENNNSRYSSVYISINDEVKGSFSFDNIYRDGVKQLLSELQGNYDLYLLSGDTEAEREKIKSLFPDEANIKFRCTPEDKLNFIGELQSRGKKVMMIGDGLNDAGALSKSNTGIAVTENISTFTPASDAILESSSLNKLNQFLLYSKLSVKIIYVSYAISFIYNIAGLSFAVQGLLTPIVAAILMPLSSISVVAFATAATNFAAKKRRLLSLS